MVSVVKHPIRCLSFFAIKYIIRHVNLSRKARKKHTSVDCKPFHIILLQISEAKSV